MDEYFSGLMRMGRFPDKTRGFVFSEYRQYFDQILYKNIRFRHEYALAYAVWLEKLEKEGAQARDIVLRRVLDGIRYTGEERVKKLLAKVVEIANTRGPEHEMPLDTDYRKTLPDGDIDMGLYMAHMELIRKFWLNLALPEVREDK